MKKTNQKKKLRLQKNVIGNLNHLLGGRPPKTYRYCDGPSDDPTDDGTTGYTSYCSVIAC